MEFHPIFFQIFLEGWSLIKLSSFVFKIPKSAEDYRYPC